jgi:tetratricopeptide (TPR) repeat protein
VGVKPSIIADPNAALRQARQLLGSDPAAARRQARQLLQSHPGDPAVLRLLGAALRKLGKGAEAARAEQEAIDASTRSPAHREVARAVAAGDRRRAAAILEALIAHDETDVVALVMLGLQLSTDGELEIAESLLRKATDSAPNDSSARMALAEHLQRARRPTDALAELDRLDASADESPAMQSLRAGILRDLGRQEEEVAILRQLADSEPQPENYWIRQGHAYRTLGRIDDAVAAYRQVLAKTPHEGTSWWSLANLKAVKFDDDDIAAMEQALAMPQAPALNCIRLHFALGKAFEDRSQTEPAFRHYDEGNRLRHANATYKPESIRKWVDQAEANYSAEFFTERQPASCQAADPIFIVGMQRSGSTLVEQILDSHPLVEGTAELAEFPTIIREQGEIAHRRGMNIHDHLRRMSGGDLRALGEAYIERTRVYRLTEKPFFTDKMPINWMYVGLIRLILPKAKIIDVRRNPLDCCFSNWKQLYGKGLEHTYSMANMGLYYADYVRLLRLLDSVQPGKIHRLIYDRMVDDVEGEVRRLLDFLGVEFDDACLDFHANERSVRTISAEQVRRPINRKGLDQWRPYEQWLGPLKEGLGTALEDWDK